MDARPRNIFFLLFALSGFAGLVYESIWSHYMKLFLGHAAYAQSLVLAIFMGGMAIGSWLCSRYSFRCKNLLMGYAVVEGVIGLFALVFHTVFDEIVLISYTTIIPYLGTPLAATAYKWGLSALLILPQSVLLGMPFPLMSAGILRIFPQKPGKTLSLLYFYNSIGAAIGGLVSGFLLVSLVGLPGTIRIAGVVNIALAAVVFQLAREGMGSGIGHLPEQSREESGGTGWYRLFLAVSLLTGAASFIYEIGWIRMLSLVLGGSTHAFELMLSAFILGLALGGLWIQGRIDRIASPVRYLVLVQVFMGLLALSTLPLYGNTFELMRWILKIVGRTETGYAIFNLSSYSIALLVMLPTTFCAGMTLPLITFILMRRGHGERSIGAVYAANTVGAIAGILFAIHLGMPHLGLKGLITFGAGLDIALGLVLFWSTSATRGSLRAPALTTAACACAVAATLIFVKLDPYKMASGVYRHGSLLSPENNQLIYHKDGKTATVTLALLNNEVMNIRTNGKVDAGIAIDPNGEAAMDEVTMILAAAIPMSLHPEARTAANIGMGSGLTTHTLLGNPRMDRVDTVEIEEGMVEAARNFGPRVELAYEDPRSRIFIDDAKTFFSVHNQKYDLIISEPSNPWVSGVAGLFSEEFYRLIDRHLTENGLFVQWMQLYEIDLNLVASVLKAVSASFTDFVVYSANSTNLLIIARNGGAVTEPDSGLFRMPEIADALKRINVESVQDIEVRKIGYKRSLDKLLATFPIHANSDYYPVLDQNAARARFIKAEALDLESLSHEALPALEMLSGRALPKEDTRITPSPFFSKTETVHTATGLRDYFLHGSFGPNHADIPEDIRRNAVQLRRIFHEPGSVPEEGSRMESLFGTAVRMTSYLKPHELDAVWRSLESGGGARLLSPQERAWVSFFKAVGRRDGAAMAGAAQGLLEKGGNMPPYAVRYLAAGGMLGSVAQGDKAAALRIWSDHQGVILDNSRPGLLFRFLLAHASS